MDTFNHWQIGVGRQLETLLLSWKDVRNFRITAGKFVELDINQKDLKMDANNRFLQCQTDINNKYNEARDYMDSKSDKGTLYAKDMISAWGRPPRVQTEESKLYSIGYTDAKTERLKE